MGNPIKALKHRGITIRRRSNIGGIISFRVECPISWFNRTTFKQFKTKEDAKRFIDSQLDQTAQHGQLANLLSAEQRLDAHNAYERLNDLKVSLVECVDFDLKHAEPVTGSTTMSELIAGYLEDARKGKGTRNGRPLRNRSLTDLKNRLEKFAVTFGSKSPGEVSSLDIESWLDREEWSLQSKRNYYRTLNTLFGYACRKGLCPRNPMAGLSEPKPEEKAPKILAVAQCEKLLATALKTENELGMLGYVVLGLYCGIRSAELEKLHWSDVDLEAGLVTVGPKIAKTRSIRNVLIAENALQWLLQCSKRKGNIKPRGFRNRFDQVRTAAGIVDWPVNAMRHSAGSYHYEPFYDSAKTAAFLGQKVDGRQLQ